MKLNYKKLHIAKRVCLTSERYPEDVRKYYLTVITQDQDYEVKAPITVEFRCKRCGKRLSMGSKSITGYCQPCKKFVNTKPRCKHCKRVLEDDQIEAKQCGECQKHWGTLQEITF